MKPNKNRIRDIGFYVLLLLIIVAVSATMTRDSVSESLAYSDLQAASSRYAEVSDLIDTKEMRWLELSELA